MPNFLEEVGHFFSDVAPAEGWSEQIYVFEGCLTLTLGDEPQEIAAGEFFMFASNPAAFLSQRWAGDGSVCAKFGDLTVCGSTLDRHFAVLKLLASLELFINLLKLNEFSFRHDSCKSSGYSPGTKESAHDSLNPPPSHRPRHPL